MTISVVENIPDLSDVELDAFRGLVQRWSDKLNRNVLRAKYYDHKQTLNNIGISIPPQLRNVEHVIGWPSKGVDTLGRRISLDGFVLPGVDLDDTGLNTVLAENQYDIETPQAHTSALVHGCAFVAVTAGDVQSGEPPVLVSFRDAMTSTGFWDPRRRAVRQALSIIDIDDDNVPRMFVLYIDNVTITIERKPGGGWLVDRRAHPTASRPVVELLPYRPRLGRPFGSSRISRAVMSITDAAARTALRTEVSAEFYSSPQRWAMGADESSFADKEGNIKTGWETVLGRMLAIGRDEDGNVPEVGQFPQMTMEPHDVMMRGLATRIAGELNLPVSSFGIVQDNPSSAEAIYAAKEELVVEAEATCDGFGATHRRVALGALRILNRWGEIPPEFQRLRAKWRDPATPSRSSAAAAVASLVKQGILPPVSEVTYEQLGYDETTIARLLADARRERIGARTPADLQERAQAAVQDPVVAELVTRRGDAG